MNASFAPGAVATLAGQAAEPAYFEIYYRPPEGDRWKRVGRTATHAEAVTLIGGGDWNIRPVYPAEPAEPGLFDDA